MLRRRILPLVSSSNSRRENGVKAGGDATESGGHCTGDAT